MSKHPVRTPPAFVSPRLASAAAVMILIGVLGAAAGPARAETAAGRAAASPPRDLCLEQTLRMERAMAIPDRLLTAVSLVESGRWNEDLRARTAWPWTVNAEGKGHYLPSKAQALAKVRELRARGVRSIDVGCMQINLMHHPTAFETLEEAFDPAFNVAYAGQFLTDLRKQLGSWPQAVAHYHSATPERNRPYQAKVFEAWKDDLRNGSGKGPGAEGTRMAAAPPGNRAFEWTRRSDEAARRRIDATDLQRAQIEARRLASLEAYQDRARQASLLRQVETLERRATAQAVRESRLKEWMARKAAELAERQARTGAPTP